VGVACGVDAVHATSATVAKASARAVYRRG
jgi:hypothetical protein